MLLQDPHARDQRQRVSGHRNELGVRLLPREHLLVSPIVQQVLLHLERPLRALHGDLVVGVEPDGHQIAIPGGRVADPHVIDVAVFLGGKFGELADGDGIPEEVLF